MKYRRAILLSSRLASNAVKSKGTLDALALAVLCKLLFVNSTIKDAKICRVMALFGVSHGRCKRAIENGLKAGYLRRSDDGRDLIATQLKECDVYNIRIKRPSLTASRLIKSGNAVKAQLTLTQICDIIREAVLINHISKQQDLFDTLSKTKQPQHYDELKRATKKLRKHDMQTKTVDRNSRTLSYKRMAEHLSCSRSKAKNLVKALIACKVISMTHTYEETKLRPDEFCKDMRTQFSKFGNRGFLVIKDGMVVVQLANSYSVIDDVVQYLSRRKTA